MKTDLPPGKQRTNVALPALLRLIVPQIDRIGYKLGLPTRDWTYLLPAAGNPWPLLLRFGSSDQKVFRMVFWEEEYVDLTSLEGVKLIIDCGANVGYSAAYFLNCYPQAHLIAVEPDDQNFEMLRQNLQPYAERTSLHPAGVWSHPAGLVVCKGAYRDGREWATQVREQQKDEIADVQAVDIQTLLDQSGFETIDLLKIDIEHTETVIFSQGYERWLPRVRNIVIELHDPECERIFFQALSTYTYDLQRRGEVTICRNLRLPDEKENHGK